MAKKPKSIKTYENEVGNMVKEAYGCIPAHLKALIHKTAMDMQFLDRIASSIEAAELTDIETGSMGQMKRVVNPLLPYYDKYSSRVTDDIYNLGLTARKQAAKPTDEAPQTIGDNLQALFRS
jgi:hypothetical protein